MYLNWFLVNKYYLIKVLNMMKIYPLNFINNL